MDMLQSKTVGLVGSDGKVFVPIEHFLGGMLVTLFLDFLSSLIVFLSFIY